MKISLMIDTPPPRPDQIRKAEPCGPSLEEEVRSLISMVESHQDSPVEWKALQKFYSELAKTKQTPQVQNLRKMIKPVLSKYGFHVE